MDMMLEAYLTHDASHLDPDDIPQTKESVWILGKEYKPPHDLRVIRKDIQTRLWFTYRRSFIPIGDTGLTTDKGWGCMLRCGQMVLAQALVMLHLGRDWRWSVDTKNSTYLKILHMFEDRRAAPFSIHQIALMGASEGKEVGQWFGPNTVAQVLKKLAVYDEWSSLVIHIALDNTVVINDIRRLCCNKDPSEEFINVRPRSGKGAGSCRSSYVWKPLLLVIPLRLGLSEINPVYVESLKLCFTFSQTLGVIGGKPNHALYFIGFVGDEVIYLDPHTTQMAGLVEDKEQEHEKEMDASYHCQYASRSHILHMDPSVAACFLCATEEEFESLCKQIKKKLIQNEKQPLFELCDERPNHWSPLDDSAEEALGAMACYAYDDCGRQFDDSDNEFELLG
ncbi:cysteine protease ATG4B [Schistocerca americana]|uniref:cysteine protease ATG4B n=1 Tax=Schistocerca americana TaxID=7009 RepID=UPI001F4F3301|nr:cysteine protease ATG4B [Schistocerca americana]XP_047117404.1 cysteine protease ATG4B [Schistocerca piceifrons]XP_049787540.1 cysteine protease ATG4B [Schistocerca cancellata]XP_049815628.1 cysteine protease ATG4B [Schistocerca nitens]XP_049962927.1 cysteine protease ATG4B [Schistocerca serialis cubense]XP_049962929.1 cysteine protease ATG4B [Schistocerca serialis cubense]